MPQDFFFYVGILNEAYEFNIYPLFSSFLCFIFVVYEYWLFLGFYYYSNDCFFYNGYIVHSILVRKVFCKSFVWSRALSNCRTGLFMQFGVLGLLTLYILKSLIYEILGTFSFTDNQ